MNQEKDNKIYTAFDWVYLIVISNIIWSLITGVGLIILTVMPATIALYLILKNKINWNGIKMIKSFFVIFKKEYIKSQLLFLLLLVTGSIIGFNVTFFQQMVNENGGIMNQIGFYSSVFIGLGFLFTTIHVIPVYINFPHLKMMRLLRLSFMFSIAFFVRTLLVLLIIAAITTVSIILPMLPIFVTASLNMLIIIKFLEPKYKPFLKENYKPLELQDYEI